MRSLHSGAVVRNVSSPAPLLTLTSLPSATDFTITVYRYSLQGGNRLVTVCKRAFSLLISPNGGLMENFVKILFYETIL